MSISIARLVSTLLLWLLLFAGSGMAIMFPADNTVARAGTDSQIAANDADSTDAFMLQYPFRLAYAPGAATSRIVVEQADAVYTFNLDKFETSEMTRGVSPRIIVEQADSIVSTSLERPVGIVPALTPTPSPVPSPTTQPGPVPPTPKPTEVSVYLYGQKTEVNIGEDVILNLSAVNLISKPTMTVQLILKIPSGMSITSTEFIKGGGGQYTASYNVEPGGIRQIEVHIMTNQAGSFNVVGDIYYYFGEDKAAAQYQSVNLPVTVKQLPPTTPPLTPANGPENKGISPTMLAIIIGVSTATVGGVLARIIYRRMTRRVTLENGISDNLPLPRADERPKPQEDVKKKGTLGPVRVPEEKVLGIVEGQKGISYEMLFSPYLQGATSITIQDPYIRAPHQISNLREFCEILDMRGRITKVKLITSRDDFPESQQEKKLSELKTGLLNEHIELDIVFDERIHDRWIETDTGWRIILTRGLDIFQPGIVFSDQRKRICKETTITYTRLKTAS